MQLTRPFAQRRGLDLSKAAQTTNDRTAGSQTPSPAQQPSNAKRKLTFKDKHALETLPAKMAGLQADIAGLQAKLADPAFYKSNPKGFAEATAKLGTAQAALAAAEERWLELELMREELGVA